MFVCVLEGVPPELITLSRIRLGGEARPGERERGQPSQEGARQEQRGSSTRKTWTGCLMAIPAEQTKHPKTRRTWELEICAGLLRGQIPNRI